MKRTFDIILAGFSLTLLFLFGFQFIYAAWTEPTATPPDGNVSISGGGLFEETSSVVHQGDTPGYDEDFVFGSPVLDYSGSTTHASRMFFDEGKGSFRAGYNDGTSWDNVNMGSRSASFGYRSRAAGNYSFSAGYAAEAWSSYSIALGYNTDAYYGATAIGYGSDAYGGYSTALGRYSYTSSAAPSATAIGYYAKSYDDYAVTIGKYVRNDTINSIMLGIGTANPSAQTTNPGVFIDANNNVGIKTSSPTAGLALDVEGSVGASQYCDEHGANCFTAAVAGGAQIKKGQGSVVLPAAANGTVDSVITHNLGVTPKLILLHVLTTDAGAQAVLSSEGQYSVGGQTVTGTDGKGSVAGTGQSAGYITVLTKGTYDWGSSVYSVFGTITNNTANSFTIHWVAGTGVHPAGTAYFEWTVIY